MANDSNTRFELTLPLQLREFVRRLAEQQDRSMASVIRRLVAAAAAQQHAPEAAPHDTSAPRCQAWGARIEHN